MKLIAGLGNPGSKYRHNRHNAGFLLLDRIMGKMGVPLEFENKFKSQIAVSKRFIFTKPTTYMNSSGLAISEIVNFYKINFANVWIAHDDLDIKLGEYKTQKGRGPKDHKGIGSIEKLAGSGDYWRIRIGADNRSEDNRIPGEEYVLQDFSDEEFITLNKTLDEISNNIVGLIN